VALYKFTLLKPDRSTLRQFVVGWDSDDMALDYAGDLNYPDEIQVHQGERLVGVFAAQAHPSGDEPDAL
jgi:hypothetical protein